MGAVPLGQPPPPPLQNLAYVAGTEKRRGRGKAQKGKWRGPLPSFPNTLPLYPQGCLLRRDAKIDTLSAYLSWVWLVSSNTFVF